MVKSIGTRSSQLVPCSEFGVLVNVSRGCAAWEIYLPHKQKFVTSTHVIVDSDMSKRLASIEKYDLVMENPGRSPIPQELTPLVFDLCSAVLGSSEITC